MAPEDLPPGLTGKLARGPPWVQNQDPNTLAIIAASVLVTLAVLYLVYRFYFSGREQVTVQSDGEKLLEILDRKGGKTTQPRLREATGWSASKVSRVTDRLEEEGEIQKLRMGRENIVRRT